MSHSPSICGVVLSAGFSSRMGQDKALLAWPASEAALTSPRDTFLGAAIARLEQVCELVIVVAGDNATRIEPIVYSTSASLVVNPEPENGQFSSLRVGLGEILNRGRDAAFVALVDRPPATENTYALLRQSFTEGVENGFWAVAPEYAGKHGHPLVIGREMMELMLRAPAESTAREVMHANQQRILYVPVEDSMVITNINTPEEYRALCARHLAG